MLDAITVEKLQKNAAALVAEGKGILAADESTSTMGKRLAAIGKDNTEELRLGWRELMFSTPGVQNCISGVILYEETLYQKAADGFPLVDILEGLNIQIGIKVDQGLAFIDDDKIEQTTKGLDDLATRMEKYVAAGATFAKWRALIHVADDLPTEENVLDNAKKLAEYARICQEAGVVPIVEPEVLMEGSHSVERCDEVTRVTLSHVFNALAAEDVMLSGIVLKPSMVIAGDLASEQSLPETVAQRTLEALKACVPAEVAGIAFLSGGQKEVQATQHLDLMNRATKTKSRAVPWPLTFSFGRALQESAMKAWGGEELNRRLAQTAFYHRCECNSAAAMGEYTKRQERRDPVA